MGDDLEKSGGELRPAAHPGDLTLAGGSLEVTTPFSIRLQSRERFSETARGRLRMGLPFRSCTAEKTPPRSGADHDRLNFTDAPILALQPKPQNRGMAVLLRPTHAVTQFERQPILGVSRPASAARYWSTNPFRQERSQEAV
jgi:hypothetical protein